VCVCVCVYCGHNELVLSRYTSFDPCIVTAACGGGVRAVGVPVGEEPVSESTLRQRRLSPDARVVSYRQHQHQHQEFVEGRAL